MRVSESSVSGTLPADLVELGRVTGAYGVKGWVKIVPYAAQSQVLSQVRQWWLRRGDDSAAGAMPVTVVSARIHGATIVAQLAEIADREHAMTLRGNRVWVARSMFPAAQDDEYYWVDLIGCLLYGRDDDEAVLLGRVDSVADNGAHAVLHVVRLVDEAGLPVLLDAKGREQEILVPFVSAHVKAVDLTARRIDTDWPADF